MPKPQRALIPQLREVDATLAAQEIPVGARQRIAQRLEHEQLRRHSQAAGLRHWLPALTFAAGAALVLVVVGLRVSWPKPEPIALAPTHPATVMGAFSVEGDDCQAHDNEEPSETVLDGQCRLVSSQMTVQSWEHVRLAGPHEPLEIRRGTAIFDVEKVKPGQRSVQVAVSHGVIEVLGTRFSITQQPQGGHVDLFEGHIRFHDINGDDVDIWPGQRHYWGKSIEADNAKQVPTATAIPIKSSSPAAAPEHHAAQVDASIPASEEASTSPRHPTERLKTKPTSSMRQHGRSPDARVSPNKPAPQDERTHKAAALIERVAQLRTQRRYAEAVERLRKADRQRWDHRTAQVLSYELGEILQRHLGNKQAACQHWARHQRRFGGGRYDTAVRKAQSQLGCG